MRLTFRSMLGRRRALLLFALPAVLIVLAIVIRLVTSDTDATTPALLHRFALGILLPLLALITGTGAIGPEIDDGEIVYLLAKPIPRPVIICTKLVVAIVLTIAFTTIPTLIAGVIITGGLTAAVLGFGVGTIVGAVAYCAVFVMLGVISRHAAVIGLLYALLWESLVGNYVPGARAASIQDWAYSVTHAMSNSLTDSPEVQVTVAVPLLVIVTVVATWFAGRRLRSLTLAGQD